MQLLAVGGFLGHPDAAGAAASGFELPRLELPAPGENFGRLRQHIVLRVVTHEVDADGVEVRGAAALLVVLVHQLLGEGVSCAIGDRGSGLVVLRHACLPRFELHKFQQIQVQHAQPIAAAN